MPHTATVRLRGISPYSPSRAYQVEKLNKESHADFEKRTWRERMHTTPDGEVIMPAMGFKNCIAEAARFLGEKIPGKRNATWTKHFDAGVLVMENTPLGISREDVPGEWLFVPSDGKKGGGSRVYKCFPVIHEWAPTVTFHVLDDTITEEAFTHHLEQAGSFIGLGRFRPRNGGFYGRFVIDRLEWV